MHLIPLPGGQRLHSWFVECGLTGEDKFMFSNVDLLE